MVIDGGQVAALRIKRADFVLDFLESAFDFPSGGIIFDHPADVDVKSHHLPLFHHDIFQISQ